MLGLGSGRIVSHGGPGGQGGSKGTDTTSTSRGSGKSGGPASESSGGLGMSFMARKFSLYAAGGSDGGTNLFPNSGQSPAFDVTKSGGSGGSSGGGAVDTVMGALNTEIRMGPAGGLETNVKSLLGGVLGGLKPGNPAKEAPPPGGNGNQAEQNQKEAQEKAKKEQEEKEKQEKEQREKIEKEAAAKKTEEEAAAKKKSIVEDGDKYVDPDQQASSSAGTISPEQIEMRPERP